MNKALGGGGPFNLNKALGGGLFSLNKALGEGGFLI